MKIGVVAGIDRQSGSKASIAAWVFARLQGRLPLRDQRRRRADRAYRLRPALVMLAVITKTQRQGSGSGRETQSKALQCKRPGNRKAGP